MEQLKHFVRAQQLTPEHIDQFCTEADRLRERQDEKPLEGKLLATVFYEPSTRTRFSFEAAMKRLGGEVISTENAADFSSAVKGETLEDSIRIIGGYVDAIVLRHRQEGSSELAATVSPVPIINAGDGTGQHPTQALLDVYTIRREIGRSNNLRVGMVGDLKHGRTVRSLAYLLSREPQQELVFIAPHELAIGNDIKAHLSENGVPYRETSEFEAELPTLDIIYMTRVQKERMDERTYNGNKDRYKLGSKQLALVRKDARIMHPLPKVDEIQLTLAAEQQDPRIAYFRQAENGLYARMALMKHLLSKS
jgi:aspartate carbamoyltransferase catalytic subunit